MAKNRDNDMDSFAGLFRAPIAEPKQEIGEVEAIIRVNEKKKSNAGRPKSQKETKARYTFTILPSLYSQAAERAQESGMSMSELVAQLLSSYLEL